MLEGGIVRAEDKSATSNSKPRSLRRLSTVYPLGTANALRGGFFVMARKRARLRGLLPCRFMVNRKKPFKIMACQLSIVIFLPRATGPVCSFFARELCAPLNQCGKPLRNHRPIAIIHVINP